MHYNVTLMRVRVTSAVEKQQVLYICLCVCERQSVRVGARVSGRVYACSLAYPARNAYAPYCDVICGPSGSTIFFDIISQTVRFSGKSYWI